MNILYCFITHQSELCYHTISIKQMCIKKSIDDYLIVCGGYDQNFFDKQKRILQLNCEDTYEGLPDKIHKLFKFLVNDKIFNEYKFYIKLEHNIYINQNIDISLICGDYCGKINTHTGCGLYHIGKCSSNSRWSNKKYIGEFVPWCDGGNGYILSNKAAKVIANNPPNLDEDIYEDLYVGQKLFSNGISPYSIHSITKFFVDKDK